MAYTIEYSSPERLGFINNFTDKMIDFKKADAWSIGITLCNLYNLQDKINIKEKVNKMNCDEKFEWPNFISEAKSGIYSVMRKLLELDPKNR